MFLGKTLYSHSTSLHPGVQMGTSKFYAEGSPAMDWNLIQGGGGVRGGQGGGGKVEIFSFMLLKLG